MIYICIALLVQCFYRPYPKPERKKVCLDALRVIELKPGMYVHTYTVPYTAKLSRGKTFAVLRPTVNVLRQTVN